MSHANTAHVLVVDDEPDLRELLIDALSATGLRVTAAASGKAAMAMARKERPDFIVTDLRLGDCTGMDVIDDVCSKGDIPAVVITGATDQRTLRQSSSRRPVELMFKPLDIQQLTTAIHAELGRRAGQEKLHHRNRKLRSLARSMNQQRRSLRGQLEGTCADLASAYRSLAGQMGLQRLVVEYQNQLIAAKSDDDVFRSLFRTFVQHSGPLYGMALVCDNEANLRIVGRFGVPYPDSHAFCEKLSQPCVESLIGKPKCTMMDAGDNADLFDPSLHRRLIGLTTLSIPLIPADGEMIGAVILYRKGEQPFLDTDLTLAEMAAHSTALAVRRND